MKSIQKTLCAVLIFGSCLNPVFIKADNITMQESVHQKNIILICHVCLHYITECICAPEELW